MGSMEVLFGMLEMDGYIDLYVEKFLREPSALRHL